MRNRMQFVSAVQSDQVSMIDVSNRKPLYFVDTLFIAYTQLHEAAIAFCALHLSAVVGGRVTANDLYCACGVAFIK
jgi:hypothetical protein